MSYSDPLRDLPLAPELAWETFSPLLRRRASQLAAPARREHDDRASYLVLRLGGARFALPLASVIEIRDRGRVRALPRLDPVWAGVVNRRGRPYPVLDLVELLSLPAAAGARTGWLVLIGGAGLEVYLRVEPEVEVLDFAPALEPVNPAWSERRRALTRGVLPGLISLLDPELLLTSVQREHP